jgi:16S rRNA processing protein RimM
MPTAFADLVAIGRVVKPQGRRGEILTEPLSDRPDRFPNLRTAFVPGPRGEAREVTVTSCWPHKGRFVLKLEGVDSIDDAEAFRGLELRIPEQDLRPLPAGSFYYHELVGLRAQDAQGAEVGVVKDVLETGAGAPILVIAGRSGAEEMVPLAEEFVKGVDLEAGLLRVEGHEWVDARAD